MGRRECRERGYTLIELMIVIAIIATLATLAVYGVRKYVFSAKTAEPIEIINSIRAAEEAYKDETFKYKDVNPLTSYYPFTDKAELSANVKRQWDSGDSDEKKNWDELGVHPSAVVQYGYACVAGKGGGVPQKSELGTSVDLKYPGSATDWYVVRAAGDPDGDKNLAIFVGSSFTDAIYGEGE